MCGKDGSIVFTSMRDGDLELYRMDADGKNVKRLTNDARLRRRRVLQRRLHARSSGARRGPSRARSSTTTRRCSAQNLVRPTQARALRRERRRLRRARRSRTSTRPRSRPYFMPGRAAHHLLVELRRPARARVRPVGDRTSTARASSASRTRPASTASRCSRPTASGWCSRRTARPRPASTTPTCSSPTGSTAPSAAGAAEPTRADRIAGRRRAGWPIRRAKGAASAPPGSRRRAPTSRSASRRSASSPPATTAATGRRSRSRPGSRSSAARRLQVDGVAVPRDATSTPLGFSAAGRPRGRWSSRATGSSTRTSALDDYAGLDVQGKIVVVRRFVPEHAALATPERSGARATFARRPGPRASTARAALLVVDMPAPSRKTRPPTGSRPRAAAAAAAPERLRRRRHPGAGRQARGARRPSSRSWRRSSVSPPSSRSRSATRPSRRSTSSAGCAPPAPRQAAGRGRRRRALRSPRPRRAPLAGARQPPAAPGRRRQRLGHRDAAGDRAPAAGQGRSRSRATSCSSRSRAKRRACSGRRTSRARRRPA